MATFHHAILATAIEESADGRLESIRGIIDGPQDACSDRLPHDAKLVLVFWVSGAKGHVVQSRVRVDSPARTPNYGEPTDLTIDEDGQLCIVAEHLVIRMRHPGVHRISLWLGDEQVWEIGIRAGRLSPDANQDR